MFVKHWYAWVRLGFKKMEELQTKKPCLKGENCQIQDLSKFCLHRVEAIGDVMRRGRLRLHGHVERNYDADYVKACTRLEVEGKAPVGRLRKT